MTSVPSVLCAFLLRSAAKGAAVAAVAAAVIETLVVDSSFNAATLLIAALAARTGGRPFWWGAAAYGLVVVGLGSESMWPAALFWGIGVVLESALRLLPWAREV